MNAGGRDSGLCDERRDRSLEASHAKLSGFKVGRTAMPLQQFFRKHQLISLINTASHRRVSNEIYPEEEKNQ